MRKLEGILELGEGGKNSAGNIEQGLNTKVTGRGLTMVVEVS